METKMENEILYECTFEGGVLSGLPRELFCREHTYYLSFRERNKFYFMTRDRFEMLLSDTDRVRGGNKLKSLIVRTTFEVTDEIELGRVLYKQCSLLNRGFTADRRYDVTFSQTERGLLITVGI